MSKDDSTLNNKIVSIWRTPRLIEDSSEKANASEDEEQRKNSAYNQARSEGYAAGIEAAKKETDANREMMNGYLKALAQPFDDQNNQLAERIASLAGKIAKNLVEKELCTSQESLITMVQSAVKALGSSANEIKIRLHPQSATFIREQIEGDDEKTSWQVIDDPSLGLGDCKVSCDNSIVDSGLDDRINLIIAQFLEDAREGGKE